VNQSARAFLASLLLAISVCLAARVAASDIPLTKRPHMDATTQRVYDRIRSTHGWLLCVGALGTAANPFLTVSPSAIRSRWSELYQNSTEPASIEWEMAERNSPAAIRDWDGLVAFADAGGLPWVMLSMNNFTVPFAKGTPPQGGMNDISNRAAGVLPGGVGHAAFVSYVREFARETRAARRPVVLRPLHEGNGGWFWWGGNAADFRALWRLVFALFEEEGVTNVIWLWSAADLCSGTSCNAAAFYPGDDVVDIFGVDAYFTSSSLPQSATLTLAALANLAADKPIMMAELGPLATAPFWEGLPATLSAVTRVRGISLWFARGWRTWGGSPASGSLVDSSSDEATRAAFDSYLAHPSVVSLSRWIETGSVVRRRAVRH
jgi:hypothetical protein